MDASLIRASAYVSVFYVYKNRRLCSLFSVSLRSSTTFYNEISTDLCLCHRIVLCLGI